MLELHVAIVALTFELGNPQNVDPTLNQGEVSCAGAAPTRTPTRTPTATRTATPACTLWGDVNRDGRVDPIDATYILQYAAELIPSLPCRSRADVYADGQVNAIDATVILQCTAGFYSCATLPLEP